MSPADPLCTCGIRGCHLAAEHAALFGPKPRRRKRR